ncbi:hypothetical protein CYMTET_18991 [Cymbomonas tetramitiformis]|uniref:Uncharacterized protein n=1 Tax=Cymbomonas tetramitiformis TaxID=36881 RepID=A0AAE0G731_9CHLO|nr:hypothetical protein CYMTET_18991 [Cymbomonas tetramitiformis]
MVQEVRLSMRGMGPVKMFISRGEMVQLDTLMENVKENGKNYSSWIQMGLPYVHEYLHPWILTSGKDAKSACTQIKQGNLI